LHDSSCGWGRNASNFCGRSIALPWPKNMGKTIIADGGIKYSGDMTKALALGGQHCDDWKSCWPGRKSHLVKLFCIKDEPIKSIEEWAVLARCRRDRRIAMGKLIFQKLKNWFPEGIEGKVPYKGSASGIIHQLVGGLKAGHGIYWGSKY
jgi:IMP dehydrogenase